MTNKVKSMEKKEKSKKQGKTIKPDKTDNPKRLEDYFQGIEKFIHEPTRLQIMNIIANVDQADMLYLKKLLGLSWGNLSFHASKLDEKGYLTIEKTFLEKKPYTILRITPKGVDVYHQYLQALQELLF